MEFKESARFESQEVTKSESESSAADKFSSDPTHRRMLTDTQKDANILLNTIN